MKNPQPALAITGLSHAFGERKALSDVGFTVLPGAFTVLLGPNGAGKTTLFALVARLYANRSGSIRIFGAEVRAEPSKALARIGAVFQQPTLDLDLSVEQNLHYHAALHGIDKAAAAGRIAAELARLGLAERARDRVRQLSGGLRRRVEVARALLHRPSLLLLDEPTVGLDIGSRQFLLDHIRGLCRTEGLAVLWATHLIDEADSGARVVVLRQGRVAAQGAAPEVVRATGAADMKDAFERLTAA